MMFRKPYDGKRYRSTLDCSNKPSVTKQSFAKQCDINHIMARYRKTGLVDHVSQFKGDYSDLTDVPSYQEAMNKIILAKDCFSSLPSDIRKHFDNDPAQFLAFVSDPNNVDAMVEMGLATRREVPAAVPPEVPDEVPAVADGGVQ